MAAKAQPGAREAIQHLSSILTDCSIPKVPSESFRQAKFNRDEATCVLWTLLLNIIQLLLFLESKITHEGIRDSVRYHSLLPTSPDSNHSQIASLVVRKYLFSLGYSRVEFYCIPLNSGSRELLMAFGWLLHKSRLIEKLYAYHVEMASTIWVPLRANKAFTVRGVVGESESIEAEMVEIMNDLSREAQGQKAMSRRQSNDATMKTYDEGLQKLAWIRGRLQAKWKSTLTSRMAYQKLAHRLHKSTLIQQQSSHTSANKPPHLSVHELFLLRYREQLSSYLKQMEHHVSCLQKLIQWQLYETVFWQWMESVLDLHEREKASLLAAKQKEQEAEDADSAKTSNSRNGVGDQLEGVQRLKDKVQVLEREVCSLLEKHRPYLEKIQRVWQLKAKTVHCGEMEREYAQNGMKLESLLSKTNHHLQLKLGRIKETTSMVETLTTLDRAVYVMENVEPPRRKSVEFQHRSNAKLLQKSRCFYGEILSELERTQAVIQYLKESIHRQLLLREQTFSMSVYKIEK